MYCPRCAAQSVDDAKFCRSCGADLKAVALAISGKKLPAKGGKDKAKSAKTEKSPAEKRFDEYIEGSFWTAVFSLGVILGGGFLASILAEKLHIGRWMAVAYLILSSTAFLIVFGLSLWETLRMAGMMKKTNSETLPGARDTDKIIPAESSMPSELAPSVTENTTRSLEPMPSEHAAKQ